MNQKIRTRFLATFLAAIFCQESFAIPINKYPELAKANYFFLMDQDTGEVLLEKNADAQVSPSSMTKLMTAYVVFDKLKQGKIKLTDQCVIGKAAWRKSGSKMFLSYGDVVSVDSLITGLLVVSGNDAAVALAEASAGSVENFAQMMNEAGKKIGLKNSHFKNPHGLNQPGHYMSLRDLSIVASRIASDFPEYLHYFSETNFTYKKIIRRNTNPLIKMEYEGVTGMKTGHTNQGGYGMVGTATRGSRRLIAITNEAKTARQREIIITQLMDYGFNDHKKITLFGKEKTIAKARTWLGEKSMVELVSKEDVAINILGSQELSAVEVKLKYPGPVYTPINKDQEIATLIVKIAGKKIREVPLFANENIDKADYFTRICEITKYKLNQFFTIIKRN
ncbi:MAG: D-alanyl-D-alanine carboxypeptidase [Rickettsiaceae bacterium]|jgi:D-alanyl-D-alanine carboxypeptidase (penicillin-binding protein 5/6)|nr:D-alanyl-D-alanine carboxypeptidase [Rickettsiaceae bacterium]